ncbi:taurine ABC transport system permease protein TauC [Thermacetogenium phaeum DSM 12270]|jgi:NitT/TauT family transport system permease protein|uniref:Taurine ABC transport system permease protein TauC n=1 Tax=Thermacetogenium phaeum (strain ATCC BAA-254 / DSM 26808 / PB) TaxID=1089553 RepID=K4LEY4_THEPS|nr:ABC transporter permease [Thermacetogenium phaeum]AFV11596.1 taurine ABC transport system permease protein TauC [Thermacetogenium phaeum DSM 12270]
MTGNNRSNKKYLNYFFAVLVLLLGWEIFALLLRNPALPRPLPALITFIHVFPEGLWRHFLISTYRVLVSLLLGLAIAVPLGLYIGRNSKLDQWLAPQLYLLYPIPKIALLPVVFAIFKIGDLSKIILIVLIIFFQILVTSRDAAKKIPANTILSVLSLGATTKDVYRHVIIPGCLPEIFTAVRISLGTAISVLFFAESFATLEGLGYFIFDAWSRVNYPEMFAGIIAISLQGFILFLLVDLIQRFVCPWLYV